MLRRFGEPCEIYKHPANRFVAGFIGSPAMNLMAGRIARPNAVAPFTLPAPRGVDIGRLVAARR